MATEDLLVSVNERDFILAALAQGQRADGRTLLEMRQARYMLQDAKLQMKAINNCLHVSYYESHAGLPHTGTVRRQGYGGSAVRIHPVRDDSYACAQCCKARTVTATEIVKHFRVFSIQMHLQGCVYGHCVSRQAVC